MSSSWAASALSLVGGSGRRHARRRGAARLARPQGRRPPPPRPRAAAAPDERCPASSTSSRPGWPRPTRCPSPRPPRRGSAPAGDPASGLMILTDMPSAEDARPASVSGEAGALFDRMLAAIGRGRETDLSRRPSRRSARRRPASIGESAATLRRARPPPYRPRRAQGAAAVRRRLRARPCSARRCRRRAAAGTRSQTPRRPDQDFGNHQAAKIC